MGEIIDKINKTNVTVHEQLNASNDKAAKVEFLENLESLASIRQEVENSWMNDKGKRLAGMILEDSWKKNEFLAANPAYNKANTPEEKAEATEWHKEANANLYGKPDKDTLLALLGKKFAKINPEKLSDEEHKIYDKLFKRVGFSGGPKAKGSNRGRKPQNAV